MNNPYAWNIVNPHLCYGRDALLSEMLSGLPGSPRYSFGLAGGRRMGKSTLLRRVEIELRAGADQWRSGGLLVIPLYIDGLTLPRPLSASAVWSCLLSELQSALPDQPLQAHDLPDFNAFKQTVQPVLSSLAERPRVIVIFDEIEPILVCEWALGFLGQWRALLSNTPGLSEYFTAVFAGAQEMAVLQRDVGSPLKDVLEWRSLRNLEFEDACQLMQDPIEHEWPGIFLTQAYLETGGHPMLLQYLMQHIYAALPGSAEHALEQTIARFMRGHGWQFGEWWGRYCTPLAQRVYVRLPDDGSTLSLRALTREFGLNEANDALEILQHIGLAAAEEDGFAFRYSGEMFRHWYRVYGTLAEAPQHDPQLYERLAIIGPELANKYLSAWRIYQNDIPNYSGVLVELRGVLEYLVDRYAPNDHVQAMPGFKLETDRQEPTLRQRIRYLARQLYDAERTKEITSDYNLLEIACEQLTQLATMAHRSASGMVHEQATREMAYKALKQWDSILAQLVPSSL